LTAARRSFLGAPLDPVSMQEAVGLVARAVGARTPLLLHGCLHSSMVARLHRDAELREVFWGLDLVTADGQGVVWCSRLFGHAVPERVSGIDLMETLLALADARRYRVFLLGAREGVLARAAAVIADRHPDLTIAGRHHGYFAPDEEERIVREIAAAEADLLFVALPTPAKEHFLARNRDGLNVAFAMGVGGSLDVVAGVRWRAPRWMQAIGLEWLVRLVQEPVRLAPVLLGGNSRFLGLVARALVTSRGRAPLRRGAAAGSAFDPGERRR
jgi:N-acetylglucosaminyldiphosphoundecaprenol N-acetyl-beta-D-mannosaminyltransferase